MADYNSSYTGAQIDAAIAATSAIAANTTHSSGDGSDHADVALNTAHRSADGSDHTFIDQSVVSGAAPTFSGANITGIPDTGLSSGTTVVSAGAGDSGKLVKLDAAGHIDASAVNDADISLDNITEGLTNKFFTATEETKLAGIETGADVTDATNVDAAGAVMNTDTSTAAMQFVIDEDTLVSDSNTKVPTQQSTKAYVDTHIADTTTHGVTGNIVGVSDTQTLTNKTINSASNTITVTASNVSDFDTEVSNNASVVANTAKVTNATHTGEVTGSGALTIADNVVDEANLKIDNSPTDDYYLTAKSAAAGGLTWKQKDTTSFIIACSDETTDLTTGTAKVTFRMPYAFTLTEVRASVNTASVGAAITVDINESGTTILSTKLTIDASEKTSETAATAAVISDSSLADDAEITIDIDQVGSSTAGKGLKVALIGRQA